MIPKFIYLAPLSKKIYKLTQIEKISDLPFCLVVLKITTKKKKKKTFKQTKKTNQTNHKSKKEKKKEYPWGNIADQALPSLIWPLIFEISPQSSLYSL